jgi:hypothetical protein
MNSIAHDILAANEQLRRERRSCSSCGLPVASPFVERCPRCYQPLPKLDIQCQGCVHRVLCPQKAGTERDGTPSLS